MFDDNGSLYAYVGIQLRKQQFLATMEIYNVYIAFLSNLT